jgi:hypothetical protein
MRINFTIAILQLLYYSIAAQQPAFPAAQGGGMFASGARGGNVYEVTSLNDTGVGSLRDAVSQANRTIVFKVGGVINLKSRLNIAQNNITIAGQTAPGDGICVTGHNVFIRASNIIIRYMRFRLGDANKIEDDALSSYSGNYQNIIIDHCSVSWGVDEVASFYDIKNFTLQYCIISESLYTSFHSKGNHGYAGIWGGENATYHHNLIAHHSSRPPRLQGNRYKDQKYRDSVELSNNVIYNWGTTNSVHGGEGGAYNMRNNYYRSGPATPGNLTVSSTSNKRNRILQYTSMYREDNDTVFGGRFFIHGNMVHGYPDVSADNWSRGVHKDSYVGADALIARNKQSEPFPFASFEPEPADKAYEEVLRHGGASFPKRDIIDERIVNEVRSGTATYGGSGYTAGVSKPTGIIDSPSNIGGMPEYKTATPPVDTDKDGIPDEWELANGLNPNNMSDGRQIAANGYSNLENYLEALVLGGISNNQQIILDKISIYPTISNNIIYIENNSGVEITEVKIYDIIGKEMGKTQFLISSGEKSPIDISNLTNGSFILKCYTDLGEMQLRFVKN